MKPSEKQKFKSKNLISEKNISTWDKKRMAFFAKKPVCRKCGDALDHYSRTMVCRKCQKRTDIENRREKRLVYMNKYYEEHKEEISRRRKVKYQNSRW